MDAEGNSPTFPHLRGLKEGDVASSRIKQVSLTLAQNDAFVLPQDLKILALPCLMTAVCACKYYKVLEVVRMPVSGCQWAIWCDSPVPGQC